jgi:hypothetical protein
VLSVALTADAKSAPPLIADLVPGHNQAKEFDKKSGSTGIDAGKEFAKPLVSEALRMRQSIFIEGEAGKNVVLDVIKEEGFIVEYLTDEMIARRVPGFGNLRTIFGRRDHLAMLVSNAERTQSCYVFTCMQFASTVGGPQSAHRSGNFAMPFFHDWIRAFLIFCKCAKTSHLSALHNYRRVAAQQFSFQGWSRQDHSNAICKRQVLGTTHNGN